MISSDVTLSVDSPLHRTSVLEQTVIQTWLSLLFSAFTPPEKKTNHICWPQIRSENIDLAYFLSYENLLSEKFLISFLRAKTLR